MGVIQRTLAQSRAGHTAGAMNSIPTNLPKYNEYLYGLRQGSYINLIAETAVGKTSLGRHLYLHTPYEEYLRINDPTRLDVLFLDFSLEIADTINCANAISRKAYIDYNKVIPLAKIFGWGDNRLDEEETVLVNSYEDYFKAFQEKVIVVDGEVSPELFHKVCLEAAKRNGRFEKSGNSIADCYNYTPNNPNLYVIGLIDTVNLAEGEAVKQTMDKLSRYAVLFRNKCNFTFIVLQQISAEIASTERGRFSSTVPVLRDAEDSRRPGKDSNIVIALHEPLRHLLPDKTVFKGYDMIRMQAWLRTLHILKHREGVMNKYIPLKMSGAVSYWEQLPYAKDMTDELYDQATKY